MSRRKQQLALWAALLSVTSGACVRNLPAAPTPNTNPPTIQAQPAAPGQGRLIVEVTDGAIPVSRVHMAPVALTNATGDTRFSFQEEKELLCDTGQCVVDVPTGNILLGFPVLGDSGETEVELVHVSANPTVYRRTLAYSTGSKGGYTFGIVSTSFGGMALATGAALLPIGLSKDSDGMTTAGAITLGAGAAITLMGILLMKRAAPVYRPGSAVHFDF